MGGKSSSGDVVTHTGSGVLIMEDAITYEAKWSREFFRTNYAAQDVRVQQVALDLTNNLLYVALNPIVIIKMDAVTAIIYL